MHKVTLYSWVPYLLCSLGKNQFHLIESHRNSLMELDLESKHFRCKI